TDSIGPEGILSVHFYGLIPITRQCIDGAVPIDVGVDKMSYRFPLYRIPSPVRIDGIFGDKLDVFLKKTDHFNGKTKNRKPIDSPMGKKSPSLDSFHPQEQQRQDQKDFFH